MIKRPDGFIRGGAGGLYADWSQTPGRGLVDIHRLHKTKPGRAYPTLLTDNGDGTLTVEFNGYQPGHGHPVEHHDVRWSADGGRTWTTSTARTGNIAPLKSLFPIATPVPEPGTYALLFAGFVGALVILRRRTT